MTNAILGIGGGASLALASLPSFDWRIPALAVAIIGGALWGARRARREQIRRRMVREYLAEPDE